MIASRERPGDERGVLRQVRVRRVDRLFLRVGLEAQQLALAAVEGEGERAQHLVGILELAHVPQRVGEREAGEVAGDVGDVRHSARPS